MTAAKIDLMAKPFLKTSAQVIATKVAARLQHGQRRPGLAVILVGQDPASHVYVQNKRRACEEVGFYSESYDYPATVSAETLFNKIDELNNSPLIDGILVQLPLPPHIPSDIILESIVPHKDVDGFHVYNMGKLVQNQPGLRPCTPIGIMTLLSNTDVEIKGVITALLVHHESLEDPWHLSS